MAETKTLRALARLLSYPDEQTVEAAELLYIILQDRLPEAAAGVAGFGVLLERHALWEMEETFTRTFDVNPACALEIGWHLFGEEYARGMFLVRMREELRKYGLPESAELPDHITHVLAIVAAMPDIEAERFVRACVLPAVWKMQAALADRENPYGKVIACLAEVLQYVWGDAETQRNDVESNLSDRRTIPEGVDLLHAFPVADAPIECGGGCSHASPHEFVQLSLNGIPEGRPET